MNRRFPEVSIFDDALMRHHSKIFPSEFLQNSFRSS